MSEGYEIPITYCEDCREPLYQDDSAFWWDMHFLCEDCYDKRAEEEKKDNKQIVYREDFR